MEPIEPSQEFPQEKGDPVSRDPVANIKKLLKRRPRRLKAVKPEGTKSGVGLWRAAALASLIINVFFLTLILVLGARLFNFKTAVAEPLLDGVYNALGQMGEVEVQTEIQVSSEVPVAFDLALQRDTVVTLSQPVRIEGAYLSIRSATFSVDAPSTIDLPVGTQLPITLDMMVPVNTTVPVTFSMPVDLALSESDLQPAIQAIQDLVEPYKQLVQDTPDCWQMLLWGGACPE